MAVVNAAPLEAPLVSSQAELPSGSDGGPAERGEPPWRASLCGKIFYTWVARGVLRHGRQLGPTGQLGLQHVFGIGPGSEPEKLGDDVAESWRHTTRASGEAASLWRALWSVYRARLLLLLFLAGSHDVIAFADPFFTNRLIDFAGDSGSTKAHGLLLACSFLACRLTYITLENNMGMFGELISEQLKAGLVALIFRKTLLLRQDAFLALSSGKLNNLITTDVDKLRNVIWESTSVIGCPIKVVISAVALHYLFGTALYIGLLAMMLLAALNRPAVRILERMYERAQKKKDERVHLVGEMISAILIVKCHAWEEAASSQVQAARREEIRAIFGCVLGDNCIRAINSSLIPLTTLVIFASYTLLYPGAQLTAAAAFTAVNLLDMLQDALFYLPQLLVAVAEMRVSMERLRMLMLLPEAALPATGPIPPLRPGAERPVPLPAAEPAVEFAGASFAWQKLSAGVEEEEAIQGTQRRCGCWPQRESGSPSLPQELTEVAAPPFSLSDLTLRVPEGALVGVLGATGSGKSSLLQAVLGEMPLASAGAVVHVDRTGVLAFAPQQPWILSGTIRQNVLFGQPYSGKAYRETLACCDLDQDLAQLASGDMTRVGEKGIALSGGQKARLGLARAVYRRQESRLYLLDDPYSALDTHVAEKVHKQVVCGLLRSKTRLLATNRLEFASACDLVVVMDSGRIQGFGPYSEVKESCQALERLFAGSQAQAEGGGEAAQAQGGLGPQQVSLQRQKSGGRQTSGDGFSLQRSTSSGSADGADGEGQEELDDEFRATGMVERRVLLYYLRNMGGAKTLSLLLLCCASSEGLRLFGLWWLSHWTSRPPQEAQREESFYLDIYVAVGIANVLMGEATGVATSVLGFRAGSQIHSAMLTALFRAPMSFFQDTPHGRMINRFSKDTEECDGTLPYQLGSFLVATLSSLGCFLMVGWNAPIALLVFLPMAPLYIALQRLYNRTITDVRRLSKTTSSPIYDHFASLCRENGLSVVRAFHEVRTQVQMNHALLRNRLRCDLTLVYVEFWYYQRVEPLGALLIFLVSAFVALGHNRWVTAGSAALALSMSMQLMRRLPQFIRTFSDLTVSFNCVERMFEYTFDLPSEALAVVEDKRPPPGWPAQGLLEVQDLQLRYRQGSPLALRGLSFCLAAGERVGVAGRTGAGKSTLLLALFRTVEPEPGSSIHLDGVDVLTMGLRDLRSHLSIIPQDPVLFQGPLRRNCDPFGEHSDDLLWQALEDAQLASWLRQQEPPADLDFEVHEGGQNLSLGQRQLVALARAVLRHSKLVVLDEATAALDAATDAAIQRGVRRCFSGATTLTIAHRLRTILDSDRVMVLEQGLLAEFAPPEELMNATGGIFREMVKQQASE